MRRIVLLVLLSGLVGSASAVDWSGRAKLEAMTDRYGERAPESALGYGQSRELAGQLRLAFAAGSGHWSLRSAWQLDARTGSALRLERALLTQFPALPQVDGQGGYWDLDRSIDSGAAHRVEQRLDRLSAAYTGRHLVMRLGRQALTWGNGQVFHPLDLVNPFQPLATDTVYKRGTDMAYAQWLFDDGSDVQGVFVPHRNAADTTALLANMASGRNQYLLLAARDYGDTVAALGASGSLGGAAWTATLIPTRLGDGAVHSSWIANLSHAWLWAGRNTTLFAELYHNGFGVTGGDYTLGDLPQALRVRLARGQRFVTGRDYLALGARVEWTPLLEITPTVIVNTADHSLLADLQCSYSLSDNANFKAGVRLPVGNRGSEFGGLRTRPGEALFLRPPRQLFLRFERYF